MSATMGLFSADYAEQQRESALARARELRRTYAERAERWERTLAPCDMCGEVRHLVRGLCCCCADSVTGWSAAHGEHECATVATYWGHLLREARGLERHAEGFPR